MVYHLEMGNSIYVSTGLVAISNSVNSSSTEKNVYLADWTVHKHCINVTHGG